MKTVIIFASTHHGNTKKVAEHMAKSVSADLIDITQNRNPDISMYEMVGLASGVYFHSFHETLKNFVQNASFKENQKVFLVATCGVAYIDYTKGIKKLLKQKNVECAGSFQCRGYDTYGIFGKLGGIAKGHPNQQELKKAADFIKNITKG